jgi:hypothetical protein
MARQGNGKASASKSRIKRATGVISRTAKKLTAKLRPGKPQQDNAAAKPPARAAKPKKKATAQSRPAKRTTDIPMDVVSSTYTPNQTSLKGPFRANGADRQKDQELGRGVHDERWNDEDHFTNKSGDDRIGTHGRTYEPGEQRRRS